MHLLQYALSRYDLSRKKYSSIAVAAICHFLQDVHDDMQANEPDQDGPEPDQNSGAYRVLRDEFLDCIFERFPEMD